MAGEGLCLPQDTAYWCAVFGTEVVSVRIERLRGGNSPSQICRVWPIFPAGSAAGPTVSIVAKSSGKPWSARDPEGYRREAEVYAKTAAASVGVSPRIHRIDLDDTHSRILMDDLDLTHEFRPPQHLWQPDEARKVLKAYARLHERTAESAGTMPESSSGILMDAPDTRWPPEAIDVAIEVLREDPMWQSAGDRLRDLRDALRRALEEERPRWRHLPTCMLHSDPSPANIALPLAPHDDALLIDWHIAAAGMPFFDVAAFFFQPYRNWMQLDRGRVLEDYVAALEGSPSGARVLADLDEPPAAFRYATGWAALSYLPALGCQLSDSGRLSGWWRNLLLDIVEGLQWCAEGK